MCLPSDIVLLPFPFSDLSAHKKRPVLILRASNSQGDFLAVPITSQAGYPQSICINQIDLILGILPKTSFVRPDKLVTLNNSLIIQRIGKISEQTFSYVKQAVCMSLACSSNQDLQSKNFKYTK